MRRSLAVTATTALTAGVLTALSVSPAQADEVTLNLLGINDFHGRIDANTVKWAGTVEQLRAEAGDDDTLLVSAGDNVSASLFSSAVQGDIPTIDVLNALDLDASSVGNHEFDKGADDLVNRIQPAADFPFLAANVLKDGAPLLRPYEIFEVNGVEVAVIGAVTEETPALVSPAGVAGLDFTDITESINDTVDDLEALADPPEVIIAAIHEGAPDGTLSYEQATASSALLKEISDGTSADVDAIFMGHTHQAYAWDAPVPGQPGKTRPLIQTGNYGANVGQIKLTVDSATGAVSSYTAKNVARITTADADLITTYPRVEEVSTIVTEALKYAAEVGERVIGQQTADLSRAFTAGSEDRGSESTLGGLVADALLAKVSTTQAGADIALVNPGGLRADLLYAGTTGSNVDGAITYAEANSVLPFVNNLSSISLTGASLKKTFEQQWQRDANGNVPSRPYLQLGVSKNVRVTTDPTRPEGDRVTGLWINGTKVVDSTTYRVATFSFLAAGGDNFRALTEGKNTDTGLVDYEAWIEYLQQNSPISPDNARRTAEITGLATTYPSGSTGSLTVPKLDLTSLGSPVNTSLKTTLVVESSGKKYRLGTTALSGGAATVPFTLPASVTGTAHLVLSASPTGTMITTPSFRIEKAKALISATAAPVRYPRPVKIAVTSAPGAKGLIWVTKGTSVVGLGMIAKGKGTVVTFPFSLRPGTHQLVVRHAGGGGFAASSVPVTVTVTR